VTSALAPNLPPAKRGRQATKSASTIQLRRSAAKLKSIVSTANRATHRLIRSLDLAGQEEPVGDVALQRYRQLYKRELPEEAIRAIRVAAGLDARDVAETSAALAAEELMAQALAA
jgi:hypothetical protein